ncbi:RpiB/LacA/LacB family sugar-phosphate isomerase [Patescibacteria group bacterium]|nr:MAG: RpiB/LacA/LacB family sugar-phosphate isomerase [Patescibacteria group bacterium]
MKVFIGSDHRGYELKNQIREHLVHKGYDVSVVGGEVKDDNDDYPPISYEVTSKLLGEDDGTARGVLVCGSGQGMAIAANRVRGIRAALAWSPAEVRAARNDDDANVLVLPADMLDVDTALAVVDVFFEQKFSGEERHQRRIDQIEELYG